MASGMVPRLVFLLMSPDPALSRPLGEYRQDSVKSRAATVLRNLCTNDALHERLSVLGVAEALMEQLEKSEVTMTCPCLPLTGRLGDRP